MESLQAVVNEKEPILVQDQKEVYWQVLTSVDNNTGGVFFLDAPGGTGKTLLINLLLAKVRQKKKIALAVASSGIAATLLTGGRTAHSTFKLPLNLIQNESPLCNITKNTALAILLTYAKLIVWDEATMSHKAAFEALDRTLQDFRNNKKIMGGVTLLMAGDFRQTLPVVPRGTRADELRACIKSSYIWQHVKQLTLTTNMRVHIHGDPLAAQFSNKLLDIGNGKLPQDPEDNLHHLPCGNMTASLEELKSKVFPNIATNYKSHKWLRERTILAPRNDSVDKLNLNLLTQLPGPECSYRSINSVPDQQQATHYPVEFLNSLQPSGFPPHILIVKIGAPIMLLRNLDVPTLCNGTRLVVKTAMPHVLEATIITGNMMGENVFIPRIPLILNDLPFQFKRLQFPVKLSFAMSINKAQGQSLKVVGLNLLQPCFSHGQLYVGCSRVGDEKNLYILSDKHGKTENIVYEEALT
uniref:ATP-dependent DNA helicase n=1 Tax=Octopus bimaculoides TaxID=37653 RepID=A0A0L8FW00_OCTBM